MNTRRLRRTAAALLCTVFLGLIAAPEAEAACPNGAFPSIGSQVALISCTEGKTTGDDFVTVPVPASVANGDLLVLAIAKDDDDAPAVPSGWTSAAQQIVGNNDAYLRIYTRISNGSEPGNYTITWSGNEDAYAWMMRFTGASGQLAAVTDWGNNGTTQASAISTLSANNVILRLAGWDRRPNNVDPGTIMSGHTNITQDYSRNNNNAAMGAAVYRNQAAVGSSGTGNFSNDDDEQWATATMRIEPIEFRFSMPDSTASVCGMQQVTLSVTDRLGNPMTWFRGQVTLSTSTGSSGDWSNPGGLGGTLDNGTAGDGVATYTFGASDNGVATFNFHRPITGAFNFNLTYGVFTENSSYDPSLTIDNLCRFRISHDNNASTCAIEPITISVVDSAGVAATHYDGTINVTTDTGIGDFTLNSGGGTFDPLDGDGTNDGEASYEFPLGENQVVLDLSHGTPNADVNFNITDSGNPTFAVEAGYDPDLNVTSCGLRFSHSGSSTTCSVATITLTVVDGGGATITNFTGTVNLSVDANSGNWSLSDGAGGFTPAGLGTATYEFDIEDAGVVVLGFQRSIGGIVNFDATGTGFASPTAPYDDDLDIGACVPSSGPCPNPLFPALGIPVELVSCTENVNSSNNESTDIDVPEVVNPGDLLVLLTAKDDTEVINTPAGWTQSASRLIGSSDGILQIFTRVSDGAEPLSYNLNWTSNERVFSTMMRFRGASGLFVTGDNFGETGTPVSPSINTLVDNTLILRTAGWDRNPATRDPATIVTGHTNINQNRAGGGGGSIMHGAAYINQATVGATGTADFENTSEEWATITFGIEPIQFRFSMPDATASVCGTQQVTVSVTDRLGNPMTWFTGTVTLSTSAETDGDWLDAGGLNGILDNGLANDGEATYAFSAADNGVATFNFHKPTTGTFSFNLDWGVFEEHPSFDPTLTVDNLCRFRISHDTAMETCVAEAVTISVVDSGGVAATHYSGTIDLETDTDLGTWGLNSGGGNFTDSVANDGEASYEFLEGETQVVLNFQHFVANADINIDIADTANPTFAVEGGYDPELNAAACNLRFSHTESGDVCSIAPITLSVVDSSGSTITDFEGTVDLSVSTSDGTWSVGDGQGVFTPGSNGTATYEFAAADLGEVQLGFARLTGGITNFNASTDDGYADPTGIYDEDFNFANCLAEVSVDGTANVCSPFEIVTITIRNTSGGIATDFDGAVVISTSTDNGDFEASASAQGSLDNGASLDGVAVYTFDAADNGTVDIEFSTNVVESLSFTANSTFITFDAAESDEDLNVIGCEFRIAHSDETDVCSEESVTISVFNSNDEAVTDYVGTVNLTTDSDNGTWSGGSGAGVVDPVAEDGSATYEFIPADSGSVTLTFTDQTVETNNLNVSDGVTSDSTNPTYDPNLEVLACTFRITLDDGTSTACTMEEVTVTVYNSGGAIATNYTGVMELNTDTIHGSWADAGALNGTLTETTLGDGFATYEFVAGDNGTATFEFSTAFVEQINFNLEAGDITEDGAYDPSLTVGGCIPDVAASACYPGSSGGTGNLTIGAADPGRMLVMLIWHIDSTPQEVQTASFGGTSLEQIYRISGGNTTIEMWGALDEDLPGAGTYAGSYTWNAAPANTPSMCMVELSAVAQEFPEADLGSPNEGAVNGNTFTPDGAPNDMATTIETTANNAFILTAGLSDYTTTGNSWFNDVAPDPPMEQYFFNNNNQNPINGTAGGSIGVKGSSGTFTVTDTDTQDAASSAAHIVASFNPRIAGAPGDETGVPFVLVETLSGNHNYRAIGTSLRSASNDNDGECSFYPVGTGRSATLSLPSGSTVVRAYLYWGGSGNSGNSDDTVTFGPTGSETSITADQFFNVANVGAYGLGSYFSGYKDVTAYITGSGSYTLKDLTVQTGFPWNLITGCAGGWSLIVVYENVKEHFRVTNLYHGFRSFQDSSFVLVPTNFRVATTDDDPDGYLPNGQVTHITMEGDEDIGGTGESLAIQSEPGSETYVALSNSYNPLGGDFNSTVTRPLYFEPGDSDYFEFNETAGQNSDGYEIDQPGPDAQEAGRSGYNIGASYGFDIDTHFLAGNDNTGVLYEFAQNGDEAEEFGLQYGTGSDQVMLLAQIVTVTNFDIADMELFKTQVGDFEVNGVGQYQFQVTNNGNGVLTGGQATGTVIVADTLPTGLTLASVSGTDWDCSTTSGNAFTCVFDIATDCDAGTGCTTQNGELHPTESLPLITANINIAGTGTFPLQSTNVKNVARMQHSGGSCGVLTAGVIPDPESCVRAPQFDNVNFLDGGAIDINDLTDKSPNNNNVHSVITEVLGVRTDLGIVKDLDGILEVGEQGSYTLTVTNYGPDDTTGGAGGTITVTDTLPAGISYSSASGTGWSCSPGPVTCTYAGILSVGASSVINLTVNVTGAAGQNITNTAQVAAGTYNFDSVSGNNASTDISTIVAPPVSSNERFLLSVRVPENTTEIGGLAAFENNDYFIYNPLTDVGTLFYDDSALTNALDDADAVHLFKNGHVAISAKGNSNVGSSGVGTFYPEDIVVWDPIQDSTTMLFDGSTIFDGPIDSNHNIDAVYVKDDGRIVFSVEGTASITYTGPTTVNFNEGDIVEYDPSDGSASILIDASDADMFNGEVQVDGLYIRVDESNPDATREIYILSVDENSAIIGACGSCDPPGGTALSRDDIVQIDLTGANPVTENLFVGNLPLGVFTNPTSNDRTIDAIHTVEDAYIGHFAISQSQAGTTCQAGQITISKHMGLSHSNDTDYEGTILITTTSNEGDWALAVGNGTLENGTEGDGAATYTFVPSDNGEVTLYLTDTTPGTFNVDVTNSFVAELGTEDPNFTFNDEITEVTYREFWNTVAYDNNDGSTLWATNWDEVDGLGSNLTDGNIIVSGGELQMTASGGDPNPHISRQADMSLYTVTETVYLNLDYRYQFLNSGTDVFNIDVSLNGGSSYTTVHSFSGIGGTNLTPQSLSLDLDTLLGSPVWTDQTRIRFRVAGGYTGTSRMFLDNIELITGTTDCGIGSIDHFEIRVNGTTGNAATLVSGLQCLSAVVTVTGHDANHFPSAGGESITLRTSTNKGDWILPVGQLGTLNNGTPDDGIATFTFAPTQQVATFVFNYTNPTTDPEQVNFNVTSTLPVNIAEDPTLNVYQAGLVFHNESAGGPTISNPIPIQIAGKSSNVLPDITILNIEGVRSSDNNPLACSPIFDAGNTLTIEFAAECLDPGNCSGSNDLTISSLAASNNAKVLTAGTDNAGEGTSSSYETLDVLMESQPGGRVGGEIVFSYEDAGQMEIHARYQVPLNEDVSGASGYGEGYLSGTSFPFIVRPFGFDIDFADDRFSNGIGGPSYAADGNGNVFTTSGVGFSTTVSAVAWQAADDLDNDGVPDEGAALGNNPITPNFGNESTAGNYEVIVERERSVLPLNSTYGSLTDNRFDSFAGVGFETHTITYDEVGIIDLTARLVDTGTTDNGDFLNAGVNLFGNVKNVGRFKPGHFELTGGIVDSRPLTSTEPSINSMPTFTYMGEEFGLTGTVTVYNGAAPAVAVHNYVGDLAYLGNRVLNPTNTDLAVANFRAVDSSGSPVNYSSRLAEANSSTRQVEIDWEAAPSPTSHAKTLTGNLIFNRANPAVPDGPLNLDIGLATTDPDDVGFTLNLDVDDGMPGDEAVLFQEEEFRYGRLLIDNAYGSELEDLGITFTIEYWDSAEGRFVINTDDSTSTLLYDASENLSANRSMFFVSGTFTDNLVEDANDVVEAGETFIELGNIVGDTDVKTSFYRGRTVLADDSQDDHPFYASAPGENRDGSALVEFDLNDLSLPFPLDFLSWDWRGAGETDDVNPDGNYGDNPRGQIGFGSFRGHDRIINWQEIYTAP